MDTNMESRLNVVQEEKVVKVFALRKKLEDGPEVREERKEGWLKREGLNVFVKFYQPVLYSY